MIDVTDGTFEAEVLKSDTPVVVDFWAPWCGPCKQMMPALESVANEMTNVKFVKLNVDENPHVTTQMHIRGVPALVMFKNGAPVDQRTGAAPAAALRDWISSNT